MENYIIGLLIVIIIVCISIIYKDKTQRPYSGFPIAKAGKDENGSVAMYLFVFFSKRNCRDCLEYIEALNHLPPEFNVIGVVSKAELENEKELRSLTKAAFPLISNPKFKKFIPLYSPTTVGVSPKGNILFVLPGVPGEKEYLTNFLFSLYTKLMPLFMDQKI